METCNQSHIQAVCVTHQENRFRFANILVECLPNVYIGRATNHLTTDASQARLGLSITSAHPVACCI